jgi:hypothetical protein
MKAIPVNGGKYFTQVDDQDYESLLNFSWHVCSKGKYVRTRIRRGGSRKIIQIHRLILGVSDPSMYVDHKDGNTLNNQRSNLRICTNSQNQANRNPNRLRALKGVYYRPKKRAYVAAITCKGKRYHLGFFKSASLAAEAYNEKASELFGEFALLNVITQRRVK